MGRRVWERERKLENYFDWREHLVQRPWRKKIGLVIQCSWSKRQEEMGVEWGAWGIPSTDPGGPLTLAKSKVFPRISKCQWMALSLGIPRADLHLRRTTLTQGGGKLGGWGKLAMGIMGMRWNPSWLRRQFYFETPLFCLFCPMHNLRQICLQVVYLGGEPWSMMRE